MAILGRFLLLCLKVQLPTRTARNVLLLTLIVDDKDGAKTEAIWDTYYHLYLGEDSYRLLLNQSEKLYALSQSIESWHQSKYGTLFRMCDGGSLAKIRKTWNHYCLGRLSKESMRSYKKDFESALQRAKDTKQPLTGNSLVFTGFRSTAPVNLSALTDFPSLHQEFWDTGSTDGGKNAPSNALHPNPMFATPAEDSITLHYGTDPLLGFHLATAYAPLLPHSPLQVKSSGGTGLRKVVEAARVQFQAWSSTFRNSAQKNITIRLFLGDALSFCHALQHRRSSKEKSSANLYRHPFHSEPLDLNSSDYGVASKAPCSFNVIDTSNLLDHLGPLNLLVASSPLLSEDLAATLYTETLVKREASLKDLSDELLCGHFPTISMLLGLFPVEYWTNATTISTVDEVMFDSLHHRMQGSKNHDGQMFSRFAWKRAPSDRISPKQDMSLPLRFDDLDLAYIIFRVYQKMFQHENMRLLFSNINLQTLRNNSCPRYHRGSLAAFLVLVKQRVSANWDVVMRNFLELVETDSSIQLSRNFIQELYLYLHVFSIYSVPTLMGSHDKGKPVDLGVAKEGANCSPVLWVTLTVPRARLKVFRQIPFTELGTPPVQCILQSSSRFAGRPWQSIFAVVQSAFGEVITSGSRQGGDLKLTIREDDSGWMGESPLLMSFCVPRWVTCIEPKTATVAFGIQSTPQSTQTFVKHFGLGLIVYETQLGNEENVYLTRYAPNQPGQDHFNHLSKLGTVSPQIDNDRFETAITAVVDNERSRITALTGRINLKYKHAQDTFREGAQVESTQTSACVVTISIGKKLQYQICFPAPVLQMRSKLRLARKSSYIEIVAPIACPEGQEYHQHFMYPILPNKAYPVNLNLPRLNLDRLPILDLTKAKDLQWLIAHTSLMFSTRERGLRKTSIKTTDGIHSDVRLNYKESLFAMFMSFSGLQSSRSKIFGLEDPSQGGVNILIMGSQMRLDTANHTGVGMTEERGGQILK